MPENVQSVSLVFLQALFFCKFVLKRGKVNGAVWAELSNLIPIWSIAFSLEVSASDPSFQTPKRESRLVWADNPNPLKRNRTIGINLFILVLSNGIQLFS